LKCGVEEKVYGSSREALERSNLAAPNGNIFNDRPDDDDDMDIEEIPRAPTTPNTEDINSSEGAFLRFFWQDILEGPKSDPLRVFVTNLIHRFGPNISSKAVRHALLSAFLGEEASRFNMSHLEQSVLALHYTQQAINEHAYIEILYAAFLMALYSGLDPDSNSSVEDQASIVLNHANAYTFCLESISVDGEESAIMAFCLYFIWLALFQVLRDVNIDNIDNNFSPVKGTSASNSLHEVLRRFNAGFPQLLCSR